MLCQIRLPRLCDSRHTHHHILRHAVTFQPLRHASSDLRERMRQLALKRLDNHIISDDLSATLEAHRNSNREAVVRKLNSKKSDPDVVRPSFLKVQNQIALRRKQEQKLEKKEPPKPRDRSLQAAVAGVATSPASADQRAELKRLDIAAKISRIQRESADRERKNRIQYAAWSEFLKKNEDPLREIPEYDPEDRGSFFQLLRRVYSILHAEQLRVKTYGPVDLAARRLLYYWGVDRGFTKDVKDVRGYLGAEPWNCRPRITRYSNKTWLDTEIAAFGSWIEMTPTEEVARAELAKTLIAIINKVTPGFAAEPFGSITTGLTMPNSDIDIRLSVPGFEPPDRDGFFEETEAFEAHRARIKRIWQNLRQRVMTDLKVLEANLQMHPDFDGVEMQSSHFPLVKAIHKPTGLKVQIVSTQTGEKASAAVKKYTAEFSNLRTIFFVLKSTLHVRGLDDPWTGGVGSYAFFMMCVAALKFSPQHIQNAKTSKKSEISLSDDLMNVIHFWATFDTAVSAISIEPPLMHQKKRMRNKEEDERRKTDVALRNRLRIGLKDYYKTYLLHLQDPADAHNNLGRSTNAIKDIAMTFRRIYEHLLYDLEDHDRKRDSSALLRFLVGKTDRYFDQMRIPVDLWGSSFVDGGREEEERKLEEMVDKAKREGLVDFGVLREGAQEELHQDVVDEQVAREEVAEDEAKREGGVGGSVLREGAQEEMHQDVVDEQVAREEVAEDEARDEFSRKETASQALWDEMIK